MIYVFHNQKPRILTVTMVHVDKVSKAQIVFSFYTLKKVKTSS